MRADFDIGPYPLEWSVIDRAIIKRSAGIILLGDMATNGRSFAPQAAKLATFDIKRELFNLVEEAEFEYFRCAYTPSALAARRLYAHWRDVLAPHHETPASPRHSSPRVIAR